MTIKIRKTTKEKKPTKTKKKTKKCHHWRRILGRNLIVVVIVIVTVIDENIQDDGVDPMEEEPMMYHGFLTRLNGIFTESKEDDDYTGEENDNKPTTSNSNPTSRQTKGKKHVRVSKKKNKSPQLTNPAIKYQNNKKKRRKEVKPTTSIPKTIQGKKIVLKMSNKISQDSKIVSIRKVIVKLRMIKCQVLMKRNIESVAIMKNTTSILTRMNKHTNINSIDNLERWSWMAFEGEGNIMILIMSIYQCCKNPTNPQGKTAYH